MKTWATMRSEIQRECNIEGEEFVSLTELIDWANDAKDEAEAEIVSLYDRYLETNVMLATTTGSSVVTPPTDIFASKFTGIWFDDGSDKYEVKAMKRKEEIYRARTSDRYKYYIDNNATTGIKLQLVPVSRETGSLLLKAFYIRKSTRLTVDASLMDIPIADSFIKQYVKDKIKEKEVGPIMDHPRSPLLEKARALMIEALNQMIPDDSVGEIETDHSFYADAEGYWNA